MLWDGGREGSGYGMLPPSARQFCYADSVGSL
jgi:hypothetical protein